MLAKSHPLELDISLRMLFEITSVAKDQFVTCYLTYNNHRKHSTCTIQKAIIMLSSLNEHFRKPPSTDHSCRRLYICTEYT